MKNYATINLEKKINRLNILTWKCSDPEGFWASDFLRFCSICTYTMMGFTHETHVSHALYTDSEGMSECHWHLGCHHSHHMKSGGNASLVPQGRGTCTTALVGQSDLGLNSGRQACTATAVTQWAISLAQILAHLEFQSYTQPVTLFPHKHANTKIKIGNLYNNWYNLYNYTFRSLKNPEWTLS